MAQQWGNQALSFEDFSKRIATGPYEPYYRKGTLQGIVADGKKYRLSRLGFDAKTMQELDCRANTIDKSLQQLQAIRTAKGKKREQPTLTKPSAAALLQYQAEQEQLQELSAIRTRSAALSMEECTNEDSNFEKILEKDNTPANSPESPSLFPLKNRLLSHNRDE